MEIRSIEIKNIMGGYLKGNYENICHIKSLPCLSVVQPIHGFYEIRFNEKPPCVTEEGGAFIAPAGVSQNILHHNGAGAYMEAHWVFMNITINDMFPLEDYFEVPALVPANYRDQLFGQIETIRKHSDICKKYAAAYQMTSMLISLSAIKRTAFDNAAILLKKYVNDHYSEKITKVDLANVAACSVPGLYRIFQRHMHMSVNNYINKIRLEKASVLLEGSSCTITEISNMVGFDDPIYFSRLFKKYYGMSPKTYRGMSQQADRK